MRYYYIDTGDMLKTPRPGLQYTAWYVGRSMVNPGGRQFSDVINGEECYIRAQREEDLAKWLKNAYSRAPYVKPRPIDEGDE